MAKQDNGKDGEGRDWRETLFLPKTEFPMKAGLPSREPEMLARWAKLGLYGRFRSDAKGREKYTLHDGPPYANGNIHIGTGLNKILKDVVVRSHQMMGFDANYVPGWDCHGLPIEWKIEEQYRAKGKDKDAASVNEFRAECREFADKWIDIQREEFKRLGVIGDWDNPYTTMAYQSEAVIASELMKFAMNGTLYRGSKPVMWSVVERTALAEAEVEYHEHTSPTIWVKFPCRTVVRDGPKVREGDSEWNNYATLSPTDEKLKPVSVVIWTTTPWTIPGNRAISFSPKIKYGLYEVTAAENDFGPQPGEKLILANILAEDVFSQAKLQFKKIKDVSAAALSVGECFHPLAEIDSRYGFKIPLLEGDHVTEEAGTGFVHTAPGHGREDFDAWTDNRAALEQRGIDPTIPYTVGPDGVFTADAPGFEGKTVINDKGKFGDANDAVITALIKADALFSRGRLKHDYPHSWRSKKPVIFRNTTQWFIAMDKDIDGGGDSLRTRALKAISETRWVPSAGQNRITGMINTKPDWVISRQRAWGVPITVFRNAQADEVIPRAGFDKSEELIKRITDAFGSEGADAWFADGARERFLDGIVENPGDWEKVDDILDVWFDSGSTHVFTLEGRDDLQWPASLYLEGSDQHRGWFQSSLLESCGTRGQAPYEAVLTHGFVMAEDGRKMSKSLNNQVFPQDVIKQSGAEILRLWAMSSDYTEDLRVGPEILKSNVDAYRKMRNTIRFMLGNLHYYEPSLAVEPADMPELERYMLHRLSEIDEMVRSEYDNFDFKRIFSALFNFCTVDLSSLYFDIRKDALYCDAYDSPLRCASLTVTDQLFSCLTAWLAPMLCFTMEEAWLVRNPGEDTSVHLRQFPEVPQGWRDDALAEKWRKVRQVRRVVTGALEIERREKRIGSSLEAAPEIYIEDKEIFNAVSDVDWAEVAITSQASWTNDKGPVDAFTLDEVPGVAVIPGRAIGNKCARSWKILPEVGSDPDFPELTSRDAEAVRQFDARALAAGEPVI